MPEGRGDRDGRLGSPGARFARGAGWAFGEDSRRWQRVLGYRAVSDHQMNAQPAAPLTAGNTTHAHDHTARTSDLRCSASASQLLRSSGHPIIRCPQLLNYQRAPRAKRLNHCLSPTHRPPSSDDRHTDDRPTDDRPTREQREREKPTADSRPPTADRRPIASPAIIPTVATATEQRDDE